MHLLLAFDRNETVIGPAEEKNGCSIPITGCHIIPEVVTAQNFHINFGHTKFASSYRDEASL